MAWFRPIRRGSGKAPEYLRLLERRVATAVPVDQPLVLISQVQRSGGTLLSQLFDAHPQCHVHPYELKLGRPKWTWPRLDPAAGAEAWWSSLYERDTRRLFDEGYTKYSSGTEGADVERFPFLLPLSFQRKLFRRLAADRDLTTARDVLDCYFTSYFNAWLDNQHLYDGPKRVVVGFTPRLVSSTDEVAAFFRDYPDGTLVSLVREPKAWLASARRHHPSGYADVEPALETWEASLRGALAARDAHLDRVLVTTYERLVGSTDGTMRALAGQVGIDFMPSLLEPTFNGLPIRADSAFELHEPGVVTAPLERARELDADLAEMVDARVGDLYRSVAE